VLLWHVSSGRVALRVEHDSGVTAVAFAPDGARFAAGCHAGELCVWEARDAFPAWGAAEAHVRRSLKDMKYFYLFFTPPLSHPEVSPAHR